jgi:hypothetical protein
VRGRCIGLLDHHLSQDYSIVITPVSMGGTPRVERSIEHTHVSTYGPRQQPQRATRTFGSPCREAWFSAPRQDSEYEWDHDPTYSGHAQCPWRPARRRLAGWRRPQHPSPLTDGLHLTSRSRSTAHRERGSDSHHSASPRRTQCTLLQRTCSTLWRARGLPVNLQWICGGFLSESSTASSPRTLDEGADRRPGSPSQVPCGWCDVSCPPRPRHPGRRPRRRTRPPTSTSPPR